MTLEEYVKKHLEDMAAKDDNFKARYEDKGKSMKECLQYITEQARKKAVNGCAAIADEDVASWAVHYYQEKECKPMGGVQAKVTTAPTSKPAPVSKPVEKPLKAKPKAKKESETKQKAVELDLFGGF